MSARQPRRRARRSRRSPFLLLGIVALLGVFGFARLELPFPVGASFGEISTPPAAFRSAPTETLIPAESPIRVNTPTSEPATKTPTFPPTYTPFHTATKQPSPTASSTASPSPTALPPTVVNTATVTPTPSREPTFTPTPGTPPAGARVPILMYHHVGDLPPGADAIRRSLTVSLEKFEAQMRFLKDQGYTTIRIGDLINHFQTGAPLPPKPIILTFDDGYTDNYLNVFPSLKDFGFSGAFFVVSGGADFNHEEYMTWDQLREMAANGMEIGNHTLTHRYNLGSTYPSTQRTEIFESHKRFVAEMPGWIPIFSYPSGSYNEYTLELLRELGYTAAVTTRQGTYQDAKEPLELRRIRVRGEWTMEQFLYWFNYFSGKD